MVIRWRRGYLCTQLVRQNLDGIADQKSRPGAVVEHIVQENEGDLRVPSSSNTSLLELRSADGPDNETEAHATSSEEEQRATTEFIDEETHRDCDDAIDNV